MSKNWFIVHDDEAYNQHNDIVAFSARLDEKTRDILRDSEGNPRSKYPYHKLGIGDKIVYYFARSQGSKDFYSIKGIFEVIDGPKTFDQDPENLARDWDYCVQFRLKPIVVAEPKGLPIHPLIEKVSIFQGETKNWGFRIRGPPNSIKELSNEDIDIIKEQIENRFDSEKVHAITEEELDEREDIHIQMICQTHELADVFAVESYVGSQEKRRVVGITGVESVGLPNWLEEIAIIKIRLTQIQQIDNLWLKFEEDNIFQIPVIAFEHERSNNLDRVLIRFKALADVLSSSKRFSDIKPAYVIVTENEKQKIAYNNRVSVKGEWVDFLEEQETRFFIFSVEEIKEKDNEFIRFIHHFTAQST